MKGDAACGHNSYWTTVYGQCMACRAEQAERQVADLTAQLEAMRKERDMLVRHITDLHYNFVENRDGQLGPPAVPHGQEPRTALVTDTVRKLSAVLKARLSSVTQERDSLVKLKTPITDMECCFERERLAQQLAAMTIERNDLDDTRQGLEAELSEMKQRLTTSTAERQRDALDGQAALEDANNTIVQLTIERDAFIHGGVTETLLCKQDGFLKVWKGCVIVREDEYCRQVEEITRLREFARAVKVGLDFEVHEGRSLSRLEDLYDQAKAVASEKERA